MKWNDRVAVGFYFVCTTYGLIWDCVLFLFYFIFFLLCRSFVLWTHLMRAMCVRKLKLSYDEILAYISYVCRAFYVIIPHFCAYISLNFCHCRRRWLSFLFFCYLCCNSHRIWSLSLQHTATRFDNNFMSLSFSPSLPLCYRLKSNNADDDDDNQWREEKKTSIERKKTWNSPIQRH